MLVRDSGVARGDVVLDLGAGTGRLTAELARWGCRVVAVELDPVLARRLWGRWPNVTVVEADATELALPREPFRVVANLPFHRTTDLLHLLLDDPSARLVRADLVVEWDVAVRRALPWPSTVNGVVWGAFWETSLARRLPRTLFSPPPAADAGVLVVRRRARPLVPRGQAAAYRAYVAREFRRRPWARDVDAHGWASAFLRRRRAP